MHFFNQPANRYQKRELGPHAFEQRMPQRVAKIIETESPKNKIPGVISTIAALLERDRDVEFAYLCKDVVAQIFKLSGEGNHFCGYRNIQMILPTPHSNCSIPELQEKIEKAWEMGFNAHSQVETGGIKGTQKHIGTSEVSFSLCAHLCTAHAQ